MSVAKVPLREVARPVQRPIEVRPGERYRTLGVKWWGEGVYERETIDGAQTAAKTLSLVRADDLIINKIWVRHGSVAVVPLAIDGCAGSGEFPTFELNKERVEPRWLHWLTKTKPFWSASDQLSQGTSGKNRIRPDAFLNIEVPLPPVDEQRRILARVEAIAAKVEEAQRMRLEAAAEQASLVVAYNLSASVEQRRQLSEVLALREERVPVMPGAAYPQVGVKSFGQGLFAKGTIGSDDTTYRAFNRLFDGAIVLSQVKAWEGAIGYCGPALAGWFASPEYRTFECIPGKAVPEYLGRLFATEWFWRQLQGATKGMGDRRERTRPERFLTVSIPMPPPAAQERGAELFGKLTMAEGVGAAIEREIGTLLPAILDRAFRGEL